MSTEGATGSESLVVYVNGEYVPKDHARISIFDVGFLRGDAVFDTTSAWNGRIFKLPAHLERLALSLRAARIPCPRSSASCSASSSAGTGSSRGSHDIEEALLIADSVSVMTARPGRIKKRLTVELPRPRSIEVTTSPLFNELKREVLALIREESLRAAIETA